MVTDPGRWMNKTKQCQKRKKSHPSEGMKTMVEVDHSEEL